MKKIAVILAAGFEELEAVTVIDILRRATVSVDVVGVGGAQLTGSHGITIICDDVFDYYSCLDFDGIVLVGGVQNATLLSQNEDVLKLLNDYVQKGKLVAGICATPALVFSKAKILNGLPATCYPVDSLISQLDGNFVDRPCVISNNIITSQSPDTAMEFALTIIDYLGYDAGSIYSELQGK